ncbi:MAG TPA: hypothetical protein VEZ18_02640 [Geodermatophilus sp.]|nr:hypothetical protein [Geodermatophilus sp.]
MSQQSTAEPRRPDPAAAADELTRPVRVPPAPPTRMVGNFVATPSSPAEAPAPAEAPSSPTEPAAVAGPPTTLMPALPPVAGARPTPAQAVPTAAAAPAPATPAPATSAPEPEPAVLTADQPTIDLPGGTGRPEDAATVTWLAGPGPGPLQYPRVVPRRHPVRRLLLFVLLLLAVAAVVAAFLLT